MNKLTAFLMCCALLVMTVLSAPLAGADEIGVLRDEIRKQQELLIKQQQAMDQLLMKLRELEEKQKSYENTQKTLVDKAKTMEESQVEDRDMATQALRDLRSRYGINLSAFGDLTYSTHSRERANDSFSIGEFSLYSTAHYGDRLSFLAEIEVEMEEDETGIEMERIWVGYTFDDHLTIRGGKHNSALGYWNKTYHRGKQLFNTIDRPFFLVSEHEGSILPLHIVGLEFEGSFQSRMGRLKYEFEIGNGPGIDPVKKQHPNNYSDDNNSKQVVLRLSTRPAIAEWLNLGVFGTTYEVKTTEKKHLR
ncbi:MAG: hypothetical protein OEV28_09715, partial [Nitrospirota bacterium]|nr:hypothetical protein [Nitrospirota bacterium]